MKKTSETTEQPTIEINPFNGDLKAGDLANTMVDVFNNPDKSIHIVDIGPTWMGLKEIIKK